MTVTGDPELLAGDRIELLCRLERWEDALPLVTRLLAGDPENDVAWCQLAQCRLGLDRPDEALAAAGRAAALAPEAEWPHRLVSFAASALGRHDLAVAAAGSAVRIEPHAWQTHARLAAAQLRRHGGRGRFHRAARTGRAEAARAADQALRLAPNEPQVHLIRGSVAAAQGDREAAERCYREALALDPQSSIAHHLLASLRVGLRTGPTGLAGATTGFTTALVADPGARASRRSLEATLRLFLGRAVHGLFAATYLGQILAPRAEWWARGVPILLLMLPIGYSYRFVRALDPRVRALGRRLAHERAARLTLVLVALTLVLAVVAAVADAGFRPVPATLSAMTALLAALVIFLGPGR